MTNCSGDTTTYSHYTARGELASITAPGSKVWTFAYNALGQRTQYTPGKGYSPVSLRSLGTVPFSSKYVYDTENRLTGILHKDASNNTVLDSFAYTLNDGGNITRIDHADNSYWAYDYDTRDRLTGATRHNTLGGLLHWFNYTYDAADNMTQRWRFQMSSSQMDTWNFTYNSTNEQVSMTLNGGTPETRTYDALGRLATRTQGIYSASYGYRYNSRLYQATSNFPGESNVTLDYGGDGKLRTRVTAAETRRYRYAMGYSAINEESDSELGAANVFEPGTMSGQRLMTTLGNSLTASPVYAYHDHLGTPRRWRLGNKSIARTYEYDPYGNIYAGSGIFTTIPRIYALHEFEPALQQYRAPFRHYRPTMARWTTPDPLGMIDGPNMYAYVGGRPTKWRDPFGFSVAEPGDAISDLIVALPCALRIGRERLNSVRNEERGGELYEHCQVACTIEQECGGGSGFWAAMAAEFLTDGYFPSQWDKEELEAGMVGASLGSRQGGECSRIDCESECLSKYPNP